MEKYVIGLDYGTDSVRALLVNARTGEEAGTGVSYYKRWKNNDYCDASRNRFRQHPADYIESLEESVRMALENAPDSVVNQITAISIDTTGSTPVAVDREGIPLALHPEFAGNPNAMFVLWKDHTAVGEAAEINELAVSWGGVDYTRYEGGIYSSEWFWAKILHVLRQDEEVRNAAWTWLEHCDWIPALLTGVKDVKQIKRSRCAAGHKAMWHPDWNGLPSEEFLTRLDPLLAGLRDRMYTDTYTSDIAAGTISREWAERLGLPGDVTIGVGAFDAHLGAVGGEIKPYYLSKVMGTSTCDMVVAPEGEMGDKLVKGICGQVDGSIIPGMLGLEAGQSAFGDVFAWFKDVLLWPIRNLLETQSALPTESAALPTDSVALTKESLERVAGEMANSMIERLTEAAENIDPEESGLLALDWLNGRRTPDANQVLTGAITGITLGTTAPAIFRALVESTAFGSKRIVDRFREEGVRIDGVIALGGVAKKSPFVMQIVTDVMNMPIQVARHEQTCALGSAMAASVVAGLHGDFNTAQQAMGHGFEKEYRPRPEYVEKYARIYKNYCALGENFEEMH
jgi:L-ribulokinase